MSTKISKDKHYSKHIIDTDNNDLDITNTATTNIKSTVESENLLTGSLVVDGGAAVKKTLRARNFQVTEDANIVNITTDNITINNSITFPDSEVYIDDLRVGDIDVNRSVVLNGDKHISFQEEETYTGRRYFGWQTFAFAKGSAHRGLHPYTFTNQNDSDDTFSSDSAHTIAYPPLPPLEILGLEVPRNFDIAGIDEDGVYMPVSANNDLQAWIVLEICLNTYFASSGSTNSGARIYINGITLIFKDTDSFGETHPNYGFCKAEIVKRPSLLVPADQIVEKFEFLDSSDLQSESYSGHNVNLDEPLQINIGSFIGNICSLRINLFNNSDYEKRGPRFLGLYVSYSTNQITPS